MVVHDIAGISTADKHEAKVRVQGSMSYLAGHNDMRALSLLFHL
jgi:hypothetical protein